MANALSSILLIAILLVCGMTFANTALGAFDDVTQSWKDMETTSQESYQTGISVINAEISGSLVKTYVQNTGDASIAQFSEWDVVSHYYDEGENYYIQRLAYSENATPGSNEWILDTIYASDNYSREEVYEPGILNPGEVALVELGLSPLPGSASVNWVIISTANGNTASAQYFGEGS